LSTPRYLIARDCGLIVEARLNTRGCSLRCRADATPGWHRPCWPAPMRSSN